MFVGTNLQVGDRFLVVATANKFYGAKGEIVCKPNNSGIVSVYLDCLGALTQRLNVHDLQKI